MNTSNNNHPMSLTKRNPAFDRMMEEQREIDDLSYEYYAEELYLNRRKGRLPETETTKNQAVNPAARHLNPKQQWHEEATMEKPE